MSTVSDELVIAIHLLKQAGRMFRKIEFGNATAEDACEVADRIYMSLTHGALREVNSSINECGCARASAMCAINPDCRVKLAKSDAALSKAMPSTKGEA